MQTIDLNQLTIPNKAGFFHYWKNINGCAEALAIARAAQLNSKTTLVITPDILTIYRLANELKFFVEEDEIPILIFPDWETLVYDSFSPHQDIVSQRILTLYKLLELKKGIVLVAAHTIMQRIAPMDYLKINSLLLVKNQEINLESFRNGLINKGYYSVNQVLEHGEFAIRGSIIDIFPMGLKQPLRIDLFADEIESIKEFDPDTQRSSNELEYISLLPAKEYPFDEKAIALFQERWQQLFPQACKECQLYQNTLQGLSSAGIEYYLTLFVDHTSTLFDYLDKDTLIISYDNLNNNINAFFDEVNSRYQQLRYDLERPILEPNQIFLRVDEFFGLCKQYPRIEILIDDGKHEENNGTFCFNSEKISCMADHEDRLSYETLNNFLQQHQQRTLFCAETIGRQQSLLELLQNINIFPKHVDNWNDFISGTMQIEICICQLDHGVILPSVIIITEADLFDQKVMQRRKRNPKGQNSESIINDLTELHIGDPVVHLEYGIGRYLGLQVITTDDFEAEYLKLEYQENALLYVPVSSLYLISRYMGANPENVPYSHLGSKQWEKTKLKAAEKIRDVAAELLEIHARRAAKSGFLFSLPPSYQEFANSFAFEATPDQQKAINELISDMTSTKSMDRLICGDVGFGKTEVAMRAAFIAAYNNKQVAVLVPTTLLAQQHYETFRDRFAKTPINIAMLSRFNSATQQKAILENVSSGKIDIIIGTHKLLQKNIFFKQLGLLIIDEEHRFGVQQKEKIKSHYNDVDILALTATPIPRTLSMSLSGIKDISIIGSPPAKRLSIKTFIKEYDKQLIREAILREVSRGGQVFFVNNEISHINNVVSELSILVPEAKIGVGHGQMHEIELERIMNDFYHQRFNVLVATTIIESGIDIPTANTIIINRADKFGLAQLHQLRGRVGRSHHQAYCYLITPPFDYLTNDAKKRLDAIESMKDLGAGFVLATHDLEIRGAGEILGEAQSGQIQAIGFNLYLELLEKAVTNLKSGKDNEISAFDFWHSDVEIDLPIPALLPESYVPNVNTRLTLYKRISNAKNDSQLYDLQVELVDRFGLLPEPVKNLFAITAIKLQALLLRIIKIKASLKDGIIEFSSQPNINTNIIVELIQKNPEQYKLLAANKLKFFFVTKSAPELINKINHLFSLLAKS